MLPVELDSADNLISMDGTRKASGFTAVAVLLKTEHQSQPQHIWKPCKSKQHARSRRHSFPWKLSCMVKMSSSFHCQSTATDTNAQNGAMTTRLNLVSQHYNARVQMVERYSVKRVHAESPYFPAIYQQVERCATVS